MLAERKTTLINNCDVSVRQDDNSEDSEDMDDQNTTSLKIYGFKQYEVEYIEKFSKEALVFLQNLFEDSMPYSEIVFLISDKNTKIESLGNILIFNDLQLTKMTQSPSSLIYASLTMALFYSRVYFGSLISYTS